MDMWGISSGKGKEGKIKKVNQRQPSPERVLHGPLDDHQSGGLPNTQTLETIKLGLVYQRNPLLVQYLYDFRYVERIGRGITTIYAAMRESGNPEPEPELTVGDSYFRVALPARTPESRATSP